MKKLYSLVLLVSFITTVQAQQLIFKENFNTMQGLNLSGGWTTTQSGAAGWRTSDMYNLYCSYSLVPQYTYWARVAAISGCYGDKGGPRNNTDVFAATKVINLSTVTNGAFLKFDSYFNGFTVSGKTEKATVEVSVNNGPWTVVYDVPKGSTKDSFATWYVNLSAYIGNSNVRIGFRYSDLGVDQKMGGWAIDNIELFRPEQKDMALEKFSPTDSLMAYTTVNNSIIHTGTVLNKGLDTIHSFTIKYMRDNGYALADVYNISVPPLTRFDFTHQVPDTVSKAGKTDITAWVEAAGDGYHSNDTVYNNVYGAHFMPKKLVAVEEGNATWHMFGPRGHTYMSTLHSDNEACLISIHSSDPMNNDAYSDYLYDLNYYEGQYFLLDRRYVDPNALFSTFNQFSKRFGFADLEMRGVLYENYVQVDVTVKPAVDIKGDFRLVLVLTEDGVSGTGKEWEQVNGYTGNKMGPMGGYENKPDPVPATDMRYNFVARAVVPGAGGDSLMPTELKYNSPYFHRFSYKLEEGWDKNRMRAIVMLLRNDDTIILNSNKLNYFLNVAGRENEQLLTGIYPNPANEYTLLQFDAKTNDKVDVIVTDVSGRTLLHLPVQQTAIGKNELKIPTATLPAGLYIVNVVTGQAKHSLKLQVLH